MSAKYSIDMTSGRILPKLLKLTIPLILSSVLQLLFNAADIIVVGNYGSDNSLAAVGSTTALVNLVTSLFIGLSAGTNILCSRYYASNERDKLEKAIHTSILLSIISGFLLTLIGVIFAEGLLQLMATPESVLPLSALYLRIYFFGMTPMLIYNFGSSILRAKGDTKRPLYFLTLSGAINVILNLVFVIFANMDVAGVALATIISQFISGGLIIICLSKETDQFHFSFRKLRLHGKTAASILKIGIPAGFQGMLFSLSNVVIQSSVNSFGDIVMAGSAAAASIEGFVWVCMNSFSQCTLTFTSQNVGAGKYSRIGKIMLVSLSCTAATGLLLGNLAYFCGRFLLNIYDSRPEVIDAGMTRMLLVCCFYFTCGLMDCIVGSIRGLGYAVTPTIVSLLGACGLRLLWIFTGFQLPEFHSEFMLFLSYPVSWIITFVVHLICYFIIRRKFPKKDGLITSPTSTDEVLS